jgi:hypothetical protein
MPKNRALIEAERLVESKARTRLEILSGKARTRLEIDLSKARTRLEILGAKARTRLEIGTVEIYFWLHIGLKARTRLEKDTSRRTRTWLERPPKNAPDSAGNLACKCCSAWSCKNYLPAKFGKLFKESP